MHDQTAMMLTEQEWRDLAAMVGHYRMCTDWVDREPQRSQYARTLPRSPWPDDLDVKDRQRALAARITDAAGDTEQGET